MCHTYIESVVALSNVGNEEPQEFLGFFLAAEMNFRHLGEPINMSRLEI